MINIDIDKTKVKIGLIIAGGVIFLIGLIFLIYCITVYAEFSKNKTEIFSKIDDFSKSMSNTKVSNITLGVEDTVKEDIGSVILDRNGKVIAKFLSTKHQLIPLNELPYFVTEGYILVEDRDFYKHGGINYVRFVLALFRNVITFGKSAGYSTISQQLAKILFTKEERTLKRKVYEFFCTGELEKRFTKNQLLQIYLNSIYLGNGSYGVENASLFYFGKNASKLNIAEASLLIGMNRSPGRYSPLTNKTNAENVQKTVLKQFVDKGFITEKIAKDEYDRFWRKFEDIGYQSNQSYWKTEINRSGYVTEYIRQILERDFTYEKITKGGLVIKTTIDIEKQNLAEKTVADKLVDIRNDLEKYAKQYKVPNKYPRSLIDKLEGSLVSLDYKTGDVLALVGGSGFSFANQLNRAAYSYRPIGSSVKPFIYSLALNNGKLNDIDINPFTKFKDEITTYKVNGKKYAPKNFHSNHVYGNNVTLYEALKQSLNTIAVQVLNQMDIKQVADFIRSASDITDSDNMKRVPEVLSLSLGTCELSAFELAAAYSIFPRGGITLYPTVIKNITDTEGKVYYDYNNESNEVLNNYYPVNYKEQRVLLKPEIAYEMTQMMRGIFEKGGTAYWASTTTGFNGNGYGKSGTTQDFKDGWFAGFNENEVCAAWVGFDTNQSLLVASEGNAALIWCEYMKNAGQSLRDNIQIPENTKLVRICAETGLVATDKCPAVKDFYFANESTIPEICYIHQKETLDTEVKP